MKVAVLILLVEDEPLILEVAQTALEDGGYAVLTAFDAESALALLDGRAAEFVGLVTDIRLGPGPSGWDVARHARALRAELPVVYMTGDSAADWSAQGVPKSIVLQKPFAPAQLVTAVSTLLNEAGGKPL